MLESPYVGCYIRSVDGAPGFALRMHGEQEPMGRRANGPLSLALSPWRPWRGEGKRTVGLEEASICFARALGP
jgi:hypothetical protein